MYFPVKYFHDLSQQRTVLNLSREAPSVWDLSVVTRERTRDRPQSLSLQLSPAVSVALSKQTTWPGWVSTRWMLGEQTLTLSCDVVITDRSRYSIMILRLHFNWFLSTPDGGGEINIINSITELWDILLRQDLSEEKISKRFSNWDFCRNYFKQSYKVKRDFKLTGGGKGSALVVTEIMFQD